MSIRGLVTRGFGSGLGVIKDIILRGFQASPEPPPPPQFGDPIDYESLSAYFLEDRVGAYFVCDKITASFKGEADTVVTTDSVVQPPTLSGFDSGFSNGFGA